MKLPRAIDPTRALPPETLRSILRVVAFYAFFAALWILLSDRALGWLFEDVDSLRAAGTMKGLLFVAVTSVLLFFLVLRFALQYGGDGEARKPGGVPPPQPPARQALLGSIVVFSLVFVVLAGGAMLQNWRQHHLRQGEFLHSVAEMQAQQIEEWLEERRRDAEAARSALLFGGAGAAWPPRADAGAQRLLQQRLEAYRAAMGYGAVALVDAEGAILLNVGDPIHASEATLRATVRRAIDDDQVRATDIFRVVEPGHSHVHYDIVSPLPKVPGAGGIALVLRVDIEKSLYPFLQSWPTPSASAEVLLFRKEGDDILFLNELRHAKESALLVRKPLAEGTVLGVQALEPGYRPGSLLEGLDYRDVPVIGVARPIAGTGWWLVAKIDRAESLGAARKESLWIGFSGLLTWFAALILGVVFFQRRELLHVQVQRQEQAEKLRALQLLEAIANGSSDMIFAKDTAGRYLLFNNEAARVVGRPAEAALGHDDNALFPPEQAARFAADDRAVMAADTVRSFREALDTAAGEAVFLTTKGPLRDDRGKVIGLFGIARDITQLAQAEAALRKERDLNQRYLDTVQTLMVALDVEGRVTMINRYGCKLLGYAESEVLGCSWFERCLPQPDGIERVYPMFRRIVAGDILAAEYFENAIRCRDGRERLMAWHNALLTDESGNIVGTLSSGEDIGERRLAEEAMLRQTEELGARNAELERFNRVMVGRELDMLALKRRVNELSRELGREAPFELSAFDEPVGGRRP